MCSWGLNAVWAGTFGGFLNVVFRAFGTHLGLEYFNFHRYTDPQNVTHKQTDTASEIANFS